MIYLSLNCHHQNVTCIKMGSDESHFNVSLIVENKVTRQCPQTTTSEEKGEPKRNRTEVPLLTSLKPVLNWANVCSPNILRTLRRTMIRFLTELLVRQIWFGQSKLYFVLNWLVTRCKLQVKSIYFHHPSQGNSTNYYLILGLRDKAALPTSQQINKFPPKRVKNLATPSSIFIFIFFFIHRRALLSANQRQ